MKRFSIMLLLCCSLLAGSLLPSSIAIEAQQGGEGVKEQVDELSEAVKDKRNRVKELET